MRHRRGFRKLSKPTDQRMAMLRSIVHGLIKHGRVKVTEARGKEARKIADGIIELAKKGDLSSRRKVASVVMDPPVVKKLFNDAKARFGERSGGYTRLVKMGFRRGDATPMVLLELV
jgi:large subunit ribosomal protein L17